MIESVADESHKLVFFCFVDSVSNFLRKTINLDNVQGDVSANGPLNNFII